MGDNRLGERERHWMRGRRTGEHLSHRIAPKLQSDVTECRLAHALADARNLLIEGEQRHERVARRLRREQRREVAVVIVAARLATAILMGVVRGGPGRCGGLAHAGSRPSRTAR